jgi:hypothetical protein
MKESLRNIIGAAKTRELQRSVGSVINRVFLLVVLLFFGGFLLSNYENVRGMISGSNVSILIFAWGMFFAFVLAEAHINTLLIFNMSGGTRTLSGMRVIILSFFARYTPGKIWVLSLRLGFFPALGAGAREILSATVLENIFVLGTGAALYLSIMVFYSELFRFYYLAASLILFVLMAIYHGPVLALFDSILKRMNHQPVGVRLKRIRAIGYTAYYLLAWFLLGSGAWLLCQAIGIDIPIKEAPYVAASYVGSVTLGFAAFFAPGGLGVREGLFAVAMHRYTSPENALLVALSARVVLSLAELATLLVVHSLVRPLKEEKVIQGSVNRAIQVP